ncbi:MAG: hypothetical protein KKH98_07105 [Spirochaetes bacterium]|nr:hypothetical protein [Spirochaetota bacterium]
MTIKKVISVLIISLMVLSINGVLSAEKDKKSVIVVTGKVSYLKGKAFVKEKNGWSRLKLNMKVKSDDIIKAEKKSVVKIRFSEKKEVLIKGEKTIGLSDLLKKKNSSRSFLNRLFKKDKAATDGPTAVAGVRGKDVSKQTNKVKKEKLNWENE